MNYHDLPTLTPGTRVTVTRGVMSQEYKLRGVTQTSDGTTLTIENDSGRQTTLRFTESWYQSAMSVTTTGDTQ